MFTVPPEDRASTLDSLTLLAFSPTLKEANWRILFPYESGAKACISAMMKGLSPKSLVSSYNDERCRRFSTSVITGHTRRFGSSRWSPPQMGSHWWYQGPKCDHGDYCLARHVLRWYSMRIDVVGEMTAMTGYDCSVYQVFKTYFLFSFPVAFCLCSFFKSLYLVYLFIFYFLSVYMYYWCWGDILRSCQLFFQIGKREYSQSLSLWVLRVQT